MFAADKPIRHVEDDKYGREKYVDNLAYALLTGDDSDGLVVGIEGAWGSGKTSLKNMLIERLQQMPLPDRKTHLIEFDAWMYSRSGEIVSALFSEISVGLSPRLKWYQKLLMRFDCFNNNAITSVVHLIYRAINAVLPYSEIGISIGCISWSFQNLSKLLSTKKYRTGDLHQTRSRLKYDLQSQSDKIVVFIDDLDRLLDDEISSLIQAVKAVGDLPHVTYVLLYDKAYVTQALDKASHNRGSEFLEKIVQIPAVVPELSLNELHESLKHEILRVGWRDSLSLGREQGIFNYCICPFIQNKRDMVRFLNDFRLYYEALGDDVELLDLAGITALRIFCPEFYSWIWENRCLMVDPVFADEEYMVYSDQIADLEEVIKQADEKKIFNKYSIEWKKIIHILFPFVDKISMGKEYFLSENDVPDSYRSICKKDYIDAYFRLMPSSGDVPEKWYKRFLCEINLDAVQSDAGLLQIAYSPRLQEKIKRYLSRDTHGNVIRMRMLLRFYLKNSFCKTLQEYYPYVLNLFTMVCRRGWNAVDVELFLKECLQNDNVGAFLFDIYLAVLCELQSLSSQEGDRQRNKMLETWNVRVETLGYGHSQSALGEIDWKSYAELFEKRVLLLAKKCVQNNNLAVLPGRLSFCELRLTMVMLGWLFGNVPDDLRSVLLALREYAEDEGQFVFLSAAALVTKQDDESYVADVQTAKYLFDPAEYLNMVASYVSDNELQHKTGERREQQLCHAAYTFALKGNGVTNQNGKVRITADQANDVLEGWRLKDSGSEFLELLVKD